MKVLTSNFFPRQQPEGQGLSDSGSTLARKGFIKAQRAIHARRSLPHRVPCGDVTNGWQRDLETARRCTKAREGFYSRLHEITSNGGPLTCCFPALLPQTFSPRPLPDSTRARAVPTPDTSPRPPHPRPETCALRSGPGARRVPSPRPLPGSRCPPDPPRGPVS